MENLSAIILAAGNGTEMKSEKSKVLHEICGKPMVKYVYDAVENAGAKKIITVVGHMSDEVKQCIGEDKDYALQDKHLGTGHAVMCAIPQINDGDCCIVLTGDAPLITEETIKKAVLWHTEKRFAATVITAKSKNPFGYGRIIRDENMNVKNIVEEKDATASQKIVNEINSGFYCFDAALLRAALSEIKPKNLQSEYYLTDTIAILIDMGYNVGAYVLDNPDEIMGVNNRVQLADAEKIMRRQILCLHMIEGVTIKDPGSTYIEHGVKIGRDTVIEPGCVIKTGSIIGKNCVIGPYTTIENCKVGDGTKCIHSVVCDSKIGDNVNIGPFAYIRPDCNISDNVKVGDFVELKNSNIGTGTKISHLTYVGDSDVGDKVNFGCGPVTVNYDSKNKHRTTIGDNAFLGCNTNLVAPVTVGDNAYTAAGSTITENVPKDSLGIGRARQCNKLDWVKNKKF